jgi:hypothetical protein
VWTDSRVGEPARDRPGGGQPGEAPPVCCSSTSSSSSSMSSTLLSQLGWRGGAAHVMRSHTSYVLDHAGCAEVAGTWPCCRGVACTLLCSALVQPTCVTTGAAIRSCRAAKANATARQAITFIQEYMRKSKSCTPISQTRRANRESPIGQVIAVRMTYTDHHSHFGGSTSEATKRRSNRTAARL